MTSARASLAVLFCFLLGCALTPPPPAPAADEPQPASGAQQRAAPEATPWVRRPPPGALAPIESASPPVIVRTLPSGLRLVMIERHTRPLVVVGLVLPRGSLIDPDGAPGLTYVSMALAGDFYELSSEGEVESKSLRFQFAELGASASFSSRPDSSQIALVGYPAHLGEYLRLLGGGVTRPRRGPDALKGRTEGASDSLEDLEATDPEAFAQVVADASFGRGHPYARSIYGTPKSLRGMRLMDVQEHQPQLFVPGGATLVVMGDISPRRVVDEVNAAFGRWKGKPISEPKVAPPVLPRGGEPVAFLERRGAATLVTCVTRALPDVTASDESLEVLATLLSGGTRSRLSRVLREEGGLTYTTSAELVRRRRARAFVVCVPLSARRADEGVRLLQGTLADLRKNITDEEIERARTLRLAQLEEVEDDLLGLAGAWLTAIDLGKPAPNLEERRAAVAAVPAAEIRRLAALVLKEGSLRWVASGDKAAATSAFAAARLGRLERLSPGR